MEYNVEVIGKSVLLNGEKLQSKKGSSRLLYVGKDYVVKLETDRDSCRSRMLQCRKEVRIWNELLPQDKKYFAPILKFDTSEYYDYVVQPKIKIQIPDNIREVEETWERFLKNVVRYYGIYEVYCYDSGAIRNWCFSNGKPLIYDYGL